MKCQNCGKNEVNFHYSSNINGCVTEKHLCSDCAAQSGYDVQRIFDIENAFCGIIPVFSHIGGFLPVDYPGMGANPMFPVRMRRLPEATTRGDLCACGCDTCAPDTPDAKVDDEMRKRREVNALREKMRLAAEKDDFEKAIELRDKLKEMESSGGD